MRCCFHHEKTASLNVGIDNGGFKCFGCGESGNIVKLITALEGGDESKAIKIIAQNKYGSGSLGVDGDTGIRKPFEKDKHQFIDGRRLDDFMPINTPRYVEYLAKRGISVELANQHELRQGSVLETNWNHRILYPIRTLDGEVASIEGRAIYDHTEPRYYKEKGSRAGLGAFAIDKVLAHDDSDEPFTKKLPHLFIVEGTFDTLSCWAVGQKAIGIGSSAITELQIMQVKRVTKHPIVVFDGTKDTDASRQGRAIALKNARNLLSQHFPRFSIIEIPDTDRDPNDYLLDGKLKAFLEDIIDGIT